ncbi:hypothetical protein JRQ81_016671 [Phrynocephalus forsythii]|uniref:Uncharacterized protein n=1 Tax=Phrynocephalus forsythii TaxID=171643 RepID=A0A9Q0XUN7_9SAUR|nr:hypothetical protein JRQ81_016671 [Phrynocephalus forsythii]
MAQYLFLAPGFTLPFSPLSPEAFEEIKCRAVKTWKQNALENQRCSTTYAGAFGRKGLDVSAYCHVAPSSPTRVHKPHPTDVFLVNQLHQLPGPYGTPRRTAGTDSGFHPNDTKAFQDHSHKIKHKAVIVASPLIPLDAIQQGMKDICLNGNQSQEESGAVLSASQDILTGWSGTHSAHSVRM